MVCRGLGRVCFTVGDAGREQDGSACMVTSSTRPVPGESMAALHHQLPRPTQQLSGPGERTRASCLLMQLSHSALSHPLRVRRGGGETEVQ